MWPFKRVVKPSPKRLAELEAEIGDVQVALSWLKKQIKDMNSRLSTVQRFQKQDDHEDEEVKHEDLTAPPRYPVPRPVESTEHLARRFRGT
jgi:hypothetical protein